MRSNDVLLLLFFFFFFKEISIQACPWVFIFIFIIFCYEANEVGLAHVTQIH